MGDLVFIDAAKRSRDESLQQLWATYAAAKVRADGTLDIKDGIAAGKAWAAWLDMFLAVHP